MFGSAIGLFGIITGKLQSKTRKVSDKKEVIIKCIVMEAGFNNKGSLKIIANSIHKFI